MNIPSFVCIIDADRHQLRKLREPTQAELMNFLFSGYNKNRNLEEKDPRPRHLWNLGLTVKALATSIAKTKGKNGHGKVRVLASEEHFSIAAGFCCGCEVDFVTGIEQVDILATPLTEELSLYSLLLQVERSSHAQDTDGVTVISDSETTKQFAKFLADKEGLEDAFHTDPFQDAVGFLINRETGSVNPLHWS